MRKVVFLFAFLLIFGAGSVFAQRGGQGGQGGGGQRQGGMGGGQQGQRQGSDSVGNRPPRQDGNQQRPADANGQKPPRQEGMGNRDLKNLGLSDEQKSQIKQIRKDAKTNQTDPQTVRQQIEGVLTPEQLEKLKQQRNQQKP